jgi:FKBP-type peptidyl-prolyl cis-trans isomerase
MNARVWVVQAALLLSLGSGSIAADNQEIKKETKNMAEQTVTTESGLKYLDVTVGTGRLAELGDTASVHYTGWLADGKKFDSSVDRKEPFSFRLGAGQVIKGWDEGVMGMKIGGKRKLTIPPQLGYGARGAGGVIPPNATLTFDVKLLDLR